MDFDLHFIIIILFKLIFFPEAIIELVVFWYFKHTIFASKITFYRPITFFTFLSIVLFPVIEVMKYVVAKSLEIMTTLAKMVASLSYYVSPSSL